MKLIFFLCFVTFLTKSEAENNSNVHLAESQNPQWISTYDKFAERIFHYYKSVLAAIRDNYVEDPLNGVTYGSIDGFGTLRPENYTVSWNNITVWLTEVESQSYRLKYKCESADELKMTVNRRQNGELTFESRIKIQPIQRDRLVEGSMTSIWKILTICGYELNTNRANAHYINGAASYNASVDTTMKMVLLDALSKSTYIPDLESFVVQTLINDGNKKANGKIFSEFSKTTCNLLSGENDFRKIVLSDFQQPAENTANVTVRSIVIEMLRNFTDVSFDLFFHNHGFFVIKFGRVKIQSEYFQQDNTTRNFEYLVENFQTTVKIGQKNFQVGEIKDVLLKFESIDSEKSSTADCAIRQYLEKVIQRVLDKAIFSQFHSTKSL